MRFIQSRGTKDAGLPFSDAVEVNGVLYLSGALGNLPGKMELAKGGLEAETRQMFENIARVLEQSGFSFDDVFRCQVFLADMKEWPAFNKVYVDYFKRDRLPARSAFQAGALALGARVEMEVMAWAGKK